MYKKIIVSIIVIMFVILVSGCNATLNTNDLLGTQSRAETKQVIARVNGEVQMNKDTLNAQNIADLQSGALFLLFIIIIAGSFVIIAIVREASRIEIAKILTANRPYEQLPSPSVMSKELQLYEMPKEYETAWRYK